MREFHGELHDVFCGINMVATGVFTSNLFTGDITGGSSANFAVIGLHPNLVVPVSYENRPVNIATLICMTY